jgi:radical SAM protein with 4Fe4S-binding SPASM domain
MIVYQFHDAINLIKTATPGRIWNGLKVLSSYYFSRATRKARHWGYPMSISVEPTSQCNLGCTECPTGMQTLTRISGKLTNSLFKKIIDQVHKKTAYLTLYFQGEPYMNRNFFDFVSYARSKNIYVTTSTNAHYFTEHNIQKTIESGLNRLIISVDGTTQEIYEHYRRGGNLEVVLEGTRKLIEYKKKTGSKTPYTILQFVVFRKNEHQIEEIKKLAKELGVDKLALKTAQVYDYELADEVIPINEKYARYKKGKDGKYNIKNTLFDHCWRSWQSCVFTWDGQLIPCCFDKDAKYPAGTMREKDFKELWKSEKLKNFRQAILTNRKEIDICQNCVEGTKVWI